MVVIQILYFIIICLYFQAHKYYFPYNLCIKPNILKKEEGSIILEIMSIHRLALIPGLRI